METDSKEKLTKGLTGIAGEYYVAAILSRRGYMAAITLRNNDSIDILARHPKHKKAISIQVKTAQHKEPKWIFNKKAENSFGKDLFYILVLLKGENELPDFYIVPGTELATSLNESHQLWLGALGKNGQEHKDSDIRTFLDKAGNYKNAWPLLDEFGMENS